MKSVVIYFPGEKNRQVAICEGLPVNVGKSDS